MAAGIEAPAKEAAILFKINKFGLETSLVLMNSLATGCTIFTFSMVVSTFQKLGLAKNLISYLNLTANFMPNLIYIKIKL